MQIAFLNYKDAKPEATPGKTLRLFVLFMPFCSHRTNLSAASFSTCLGGSKKLKRNLVINIREQTHLVYLALYACLWV